MGATRACQNHIGLPIDQWYAGGRERQGRGSGTAAHGIMRVIPASEGLGDFFGTVQFLASSRPGEKGGKPTTLTHPLVYLVTKSGQR